MLKDTSHLVSDARPNQTVLSCLEIQINLMGKVKPKCIPVKFETNITKCLLYAETNPSIFFLNLYGLLLHHRCSDNTKGFFHSANSLDKNATFSFLWKDTNKPIFLSMNNRTPLNMGSISSNSRY